LDNKVTAKEILESYEQITVEKEIFDGVFLFTLFGKTFLLSCPKSDKADSQPEILLYNDEGFDFPHIMLQEESVMGSKDLPAGKYRMVCLYEQESLVFSLITYEDKIYDIIDRLIELLSMTPIEKEREFQKEFMYYWNSMASNIVADVFLSQDTEFVCMDVFTGKQGTRYIENGLKLTDLSMYDKEGRLWEHHLENNVFYIPIVDSRGILPPYRGYSWSVKQVKDIIYGNQIEHISLETFQRIKSEIVSTQDFVLVFGMSVVQSKVTFAIKVKSKNTIGRTLLQKICEDIITVEPIRITRKDYSFLSYQIGNDIGLREKKVLLIGGGSLGSYVAFELVKNGVSSLKIFDGDRLTCENIMRWAFGGIGVGNNKAILLGVQLGLLHPEIHVEGINKNIDPESLVEEAQAADLIIFTIGSSDSQLVFNRVLHDAQCQVPVIYTWLEAGGQYSHILTVNYFERGCYECLFTNEQGELVNNRTNHNQDENFDSKMIKNGCGGTRAAYGTAVLLRTTAALLESIKKMNSGERQDGILINITPEKTYVSSNIIPMEACNCCGNRKE